MARYFFDTVDGSRINDDQGTELMDLSAARKQAIVYAGEVLNHDPKVLWDGHNFEVFVRNENNVLLFTITAFATNAPAGGDTK